MRFYGFHLVLLLRPKLKEGRENYNVTFILIGTFIILTKIYYTKKKTNGNFKFQENIK